MGLTVEPLSGGCCGLAGSWGFEAGKYGISMECGEQALLPAVRAADAATVVVADGFSCRTQIDHARTGRTALHLGQVLAAASGTDAAARADQAAGQPPPPQRPRGRRAARAALPLSMAAAAISAAAIAAALRRTSPGGA
ncbi:hypothetical protein ACFQV8_03725 [Pseudonocardia benzenivorans]